MNLLKGAAIFILGVSVGATGSYIVCKKKFDERKEELDELKEHYNNKLQHNMDVKIAEDIIKEEKYISYDNLNEKEIKNVIRDRVDEAIKNDRPSEDSPEEPILITEEDYSERELYFDKLEVDYYLGDGALVDENDSLIEVNDSIGYDNLEEFINNEAEDIMYIRNAAQSSDYMIRKVSGNFNEVVGVGGDDDD